MEVVESAEDEEESELGWSSVSGGSDSEMGFGLGRGGVSPTLCRKRSDILIPGGQSRGGYSCMSFLELWLVVDERSFDSATWGGCGGMSRRL